VKEKLLAGHEAAGKTFRVHLDGYDLVPYHTAEEEHGPRKEFFYFSDDGDLVALRYDNWKLVFMEQRSPGTLQVWAEPFTQLRVPKIFNLRTDPFERADVTSNTYYDWMLDRVFLLYPLNDVVGGFLQTFLEYPPRMKAASFTVDQAQQRLEAALTSGH
jgi:arylsulfatase A-like enzyme